MLLLKQFITWINWPEIDLYAKSEYSWHSLFRNWNNQISGLVELILHSQLCPFFVSYKNICFSQTLKNYNSRCVEFFSCQSSSFDLEIYLSSTVTDKRRHFVYAI